MGLPNHCHMKYTSFSSFTWEQTWTSIVWARVLVTRDPIVTVQNLICKINKRKRMKKKKIKWLIYVKLWFYFFNITPNLYIWTLVLDSQQIKMVPCETFFRLLTLLFAIMLILYSFHVWTWFEPLIQKPIHTKKQR